MPDIPESGVAVSRGPRCSRSRCFPATRDAARARLGRGSPGQPERRRTPGRHHPDQAHRQEAMAGRVAAPRRHADGPHHAPGRRHARAGPAALRQGAPAGPRGPARGARREAARRSAWRRSASITPSSRRRSRRSTGPASRWRRSRPDFPPGSAPFAQRLAEIRASVEAGARGDRRRHHPGPRAHRQLARALRRGPGLSRRVRRRPPQGHPRAPASSARCATWPAPASSP